jgi:hypothetical protein
MQRGCSSHGPQQPLYIAALLECVSQWPNVDRYGQCYVKTCGQVPCNLMPFANLCSNVPPAVCGKQQAGTVLVVPTFASHLHRMEHHHFLHAAMASTWDSRDTHGDLGRPCHQLHAKTCTHQCTPMR